MRELYEFQISDTRRYSNGGIVNGRSADGGRRL